MKTLLYLLRLRMTNMFKTFLKTPGKLILTGFFTVLFVVVLWFGSMQRQEMAEPRDSQELFVIVRMLYLAIFLLFALMGLKKGATFFQMADINLLFTAPISPFSILVYGLIMQLGTSLMVGFFIIFQYSWLHGVYATTVPQLLVIMLGYGLTVFQAQLAAMLLYIVGSKSDRARRIVTVSLIGIGAILFIQPAFILIRAAITGGEIIPSLIAATQTISLRFFPFAGWSAQFAQSMYENASIKSVGWLLCIIAVSAATTLLMKYIQADYYEDVLSVTEQAKLTKDMAKEGKLAKEGSNKIKAVGSLNGTGAMTIFRKQRLEERRARKLLLDGIAWIEIITCVVFSAFMRFEGSWVGALSMVAYMQLLLSTQSRWVRELSRHYVYLIPETPFKKLFWCLSSSLVRQCVMSVIIWIPIALIQGLSPALTILLILLRIVTGILFMSGNLLVANTWSNIVPKWLEMTLLFIIEFALLLPGIAAAIVLFYTGFRIAGSPDITSVLAVLIITAPIALGILFANRNILNQAETNM
ncbi:ABC transporter permease [Clostridia bacterium]|nr:ABC transporter permease [Clostridia bacterium]